MQPRTEQQNQARLATIALGANLTSSFGPPHPSILRAIEGVEAALGVITGKSRCYETPCFPAGTGPDYVNAVIEVETTLPPAEILLRLHGIEADFGRERVQRWGQRTLDLDLIALGQAILPNLKVYESWKNLSPDEQVERAPDDLILPHPRLQDRAFVLVPFADVNPQWVHPVLGKTVEQLLKALPQADIEMVKAIEP